MCNIISRPSQVRDLAGDLERPTAQEGSWFPSSLGQCRVGRHRPAQCATSSRDLDRCATLPAILTGRPHRRAHGFRAKLLGCHITFRLHLRLRQIFTSPRCAAEEPGGVAGRAGGRAGCPRAAGSRSEAGGKPRSRRCTPGDGR